MKIAVCDDEETLRKELRDALCEFDAEASVTEFSSGCELLEAKTSFDVIFLDIQMEGPNGIETAKALRARSERAVLIFVTALKEYVFDAFDVAAFYYLLKPVSKERLADVYKKAKEERRRTKRGTDTIFLQTKRRSVTLKKREIRYVESQLKKVIIHRDGEVIELYATMQTVEDQLGGGFYRCHRSYLVNLSHVAEYNGESILLRSGERIFLSKKRYPGFVRAYLRFLKAEGADHV